MCSSMNAKSHSFCAHKMTFSNILRTWYIIYSCFMRWFVMCRAMGYWVQLFAGLVVLVLFACLQTNKETHRSFYRVTRAKVPLLFGNYFIQCKVIYFILSLGYCTRFHIGRSIIFSICPRVWLHLFQLATFHFAPKHSTCFGLLGNPVQIAMLSVF